MLSATFFMDKVLDFLLSLCYSLRVVRREGKIMKVGNLVRAIGFDMSRLFVVLETRNERGYEELRLHCSENPFLQQSWSNADFFEVVQ